MTGYIDRLLEDYGMQDCKVASEPGTSSKLLSPDESDPEPTLNQEVKESTLPPIKADYPVLKLADYRKVIGSLMWVTQLVPTILHAVTQLARFCNDPKPYHLDAVKKVLRYLAGSKSVSIRYDGNNATNGSTILTFCDSDWAGCPSTSRSTSGYLIKLAGACICCYSKKQSVVADSSTHSEVIAAVELTKELTWICALLGALGCTQTLPVTIHVDNQSAIAIGNGGGNHSRTKHIRIKHHMLQDEVANKTITLKYIPTEVNEADIFTKAVSVDVFKKLAPKVMGHY
jgi:hypothetical protein